MKYVVTFLVFILAIGAAVVLYNTSPKTKKTRPKRPVPLVQTVEIHPGKEDVIVEAFGTVIPSRQITLQAEVEGRIIVQNPELIPGGLIRQDDIVLHIDPSDYELTVDEYRAALEEAVFELDLEEGKQVIAEHEWKLMEDEISTTRIGKSLALREPHLRLVKAKVDKAKSKLAAAELALQRTAIKSPFNAIVIEEFVDKGQLVSRQTPLATLADTDQYRVQVSVPVSVLHRISFSSETGQANSPAQIISEQGNGAAVVRHGHVIKIMGDLDSEGRMARLLIVIDDPLKLQNPKQIKEMLLLGSYVKVLINAGSFDNIYSVPRQALREGDVIWVKDNDNKLQIRKVKIVWRRKDDVLVNADLQQGDTLILSRLQSPLPGMMVKTITN
jgi:RND family efflux transporter MFP subunit